MKKTNYLLSMTAFLLIAIFITSCGGNKKEEEKKDKLGKMEVVIPDALKDNPALVEYLEGMTEVVDEYAILIDGMVDEFDDFIGKTFDELNMREKIKFTAKGAEAAMKSAPILLKWAELENTHAVFDLELSEDELMAMETVMLRFEERMKQIEERHSDVFNEDSEEEE
jgi:hypothetical protein